MQYPVFYIIIYSHFCSISALMNPTEKITIYISELLLPKALNEAVLRWRNVKCCRIRGGTMLLEMGLIIDPHMMRIY